MKITPILMVLSNIWKFFMWQLAKGLKNRKLTIIVVLAFVINLPSIFWGMTGPGVVFPNVYVGDEGRAFVVWESIINNYGNPNWAIWPPLYFYITLVVFMPVDIIFSPFFYKTEIYLVSLRSLSLCLFIFSIVLVYLIGKHLAIMLRVERIKTAGYFSALIFMFIPDISCFATLAKNEMMLVFFSLCTFFFMFKYLESGRACAFMCCSIFCALAISTKYNGIFILLPLVFLICVKFKNDGLAFLKILARGILVFVIILLSANIWLIIEWQDSLPQALGNFSDVVTNQFVGPTGITTNSVSLKTELFVRTTGIFTFFTFVFAFFYSFFLACNKKEPFQSRFILFLLIAFVLSSQIIVFAIKYIPAVRYGVHALPIIAILNACLLLRAWEKNSFKSNHLKDFTKKIVAISIILSGIFSFSLSLVKMKDSRVVARTWIDDNIFPVESYAVDDHVDPSRHHYPWGMIKDYRHPDYFERPIFKYILVSEITVKGWTDIYVEQYSNITRFYEMLLNGSGNYELAYTIETIAIDPNYPRTDEILYLGIRAIWLFVSQPNTCWGPEIYIFKRIG